MEMKGPLYISILFLILLIPSISTGQEDVSVPEPSIPSTVMVGEGLSIVLSWSGSILLEAQYPKTNVSWIIEPSGDPSGDIEFDLPAPYAAGEVLIRFHHSLSDDIYESNLTMTAQYHVEVVGWRDLDENGLEDSWEAEYGVGSPDGDEDGDGLSNLEEMISLSHPGKKDTDGDEMEDGWEYNHGTLPFRYDAYADPDLDGWTNIKEKVFGTDPRDHTDHPKEAPYTPWYWIVLIFAVMLLILGYFVKQLFNKRRFEDDMEDFDRRNLPRKM
ncbi:MAG: hypothetical protein R6V01_03680 [Thermoplasmatota archaeon]